MASVAGLKSGSGAVVVRKLTFPGSVGREPHWDLCALLGKPIYACGMLSSLALRHGRVITIHGFIYGKTP